MRDSVGDLFSMVEACQVHFAPSRRGFCHPDEQTRYSWIGGALSEGGER
jgi:hypothetical protein